MANKLVDESDFVKFCFSFGLSLLILLMLIGMVVVLPSVISGEAGGGILIVVSFLCFFPFAVGFITTFIGYRKGRRFIADALISQIILFLLLFVLVFITNHIYVLAFVIMFLPILIAVSLLGTTLSYFATRYNFKHDSVQTFKVKKGTRFGDI